MRPASSAARETEPDPASRCSAAYRVPERCALWSCRLGLTSSDELRDALDRLLRELRKSLCTNYVLARVPARTNMFVMRRSGPDCEQKKAAGDRSGRRTFRGDPAHGSLVTVLALGVSFAAISVVAQQQPPPAPAQQPPQANPTFVLRAQSNVVRIDVAVTDGSGKPIKGLRADQFVVTDDGKQQKISSFSYW